MSELFPPFHPTTLTARTRDTTPSHHHDDQLLQEQNSIKPIPAPPGFFSKGYPWFCTRLHPILSNPQVLYIP